MKKILILFALIIPIYAISQETQKEKTVTIKTVKNINGKEVIKDTTFTIKEGEDMETVTKSITWIDADGEGETTLDVVVDTNGDASSQNEKVIIYKNGRQGRGPKIIETPEGEVVIIKRGKGGEYFHPNRGFYCQPRTFCWVEGDSLEYELEIQENMGRMQREMEIQQIEMEEMIANLDEKLAEIEGLTEEQKAELKKSLEGMNFNFVMPPIAPMEPFPPIDEFDRPGYRFFYDSPENETVTDMELKDAGIKNKPDRLELKQINIDINDGVVDLSFRLPYDSKPKIIVYNIYGDKIFTGDPILINGNFEIKIDLSQKQHGTYYLQIIDKERSYTGRIKL